MPFVSGFLVQIQIKAVVTKKYIAIRGWLLQFGTWPMSPCCQRDTTAATINQSMLACCFTKECNIQMI